MKLDDSGDTTRLSGRAAEIAAIEERLHSPREGIGDREDLLEPIFRCFYDSVVYFFQRRINSPQECEDLAQETFIKVCRNLEDFRGEASLTTWIFKISTNVFFNRIRDRSAQKRGAPEVPLEDEVERVLDTGSEGADPEPLCKVLKDEAMRVLRRALQTLPAQQRRCVELRIADLKYREIAELMQVSIETVKAHLFQARQHLKQSVGEYFDHDL